MAADKAEKENKDPKPEQKDTMVDIPTSAETSNVPADKKNNWAKKNL